MSLIDWLERLARHRQSDDEQAHQDAFRAEIAERWHPTTTEERRLELCSRLTHLWSAAFDGGVTLAVVGVSSVVTTVGSLLLTVAPDPNDERYDSHIPFWVSLVLTLGILGVAVECARSPHVVHPLRFFLLAAIPLATGSLAMAVVMEIKIPFDVLFRVVISLVGVGVLGAGVAALCRRQKWMTRGMTVLGLGAFGVLVNDGISAALLSLDGDAMAALGCLFTSGGALLMAHGFLLARPRLCQATK